MNDAQESRGLERTPERDEVLRRIGRNVMNFQLVEHLLKYLNANASVHGPASQLAERMEAKKSEFHRKTMGELAGSMAALVLQPPRQDWVPDEVAEPWIGFGFTFESDARFIDEHNREMRALVDARNDLIHHFLPRWNLSGAADIEAALAYLDAQRDDTFRMLDRLKGWVKSMEEGRRQLAAFMASPEGMRQMELEFLQASRLVAMLGEVSVKAARSDGWTPLSTAGHLIKRHAPEELDDLRKRYGHQNLKGILLAAQFFDVEDEELPNGGARTIYRINDRYTFKIGPDEVTISASAQAGADC